MEPKFVLGQPVVITGSKKKGTVIGRWEDFGGYQYQVRYFDNDDCAYATWFFGNELEAAAE